MIFWYRRWSSRRRRCDSARSRCAVYTDPVYRVVMIGRGLGNLSHLWWRRLRIGKESLEAAASRSHFCLLDYFRRRLGRCRLCLLWKQVAGCIENLVCGSYGHCRWRFLTTKEGDELFLITQLTQPISTRPVQSFPTSRCTHRTSRRMRCLLTAAGIVIHPGGWSLVVVCWACWSAGALAISTCPVST